MTRRWPPALGAGARVALVAPAGPLRGQGDLDRALSNVRALGWVATVAPHALDRTGYFAGQDEDRLRDLNAAIASDADAIWCLRGGYGAMRLLEGIDYDALRRRPKTLIGFSDITALHGAIGGRCDLVVFHGPTARGELTPFSRDSLERAVVCHEDSCGVAAGVRVLRSGVARGRLAGGNLALLAATTGTAFAPDLRGAILVLEDINEPVYRIDRMLEQLRLAGSLARCAAIVFGDCTQCSEESDDGARRLDDVLAEHADRLAIPCVTGVPVGHIAEQWTVPLGADAELDAAAGRLTVLAPGAA
jgi:muramoyltetrapeptide carboxypeptidase